MRRIFLFGILCGVIAATALTFAVAIPAANTRWQVEIVKRGGGAWFFDKNGHLGWMWTVERISDIPQQKRISVPTSQANLHTERL
jgi:hypothetical protein